MSLILESIGFGLLVLFCLLGLAGTIIPLLPGSLLIWLTILIYAIATGFEAITWGWLVVITIIALVTGTADYWLSLLGATKGGARKRSLALGVVGGLIGTFVVPLFGTIIGYALGILVAEYHRYRELDPAIKASLGGVAGWGLATLVQLIGGIIMTAIAFILAL